MITFNFIMAGVITLVILLIASVREGRLRAIIYGLPLPITTALIATKSQIDASHVIGLFLLCVFLWLVFFFYKKRNLTIIASDILSATIYVILGFFLIRIISIDFWKMVFFYLLFWIIYLLRYQPKYEQGSKSPIKPLIKGGLVFVISLCLLLLKSILRGVVVTFPFSGIFAVVEAKDTLYTLAGEFTKNSLSILVFFIIVNVLSPKIGYYQSILLGWLFYFPILLLLQKIKH